MTSFLLNGKQLSVDASPDTPLLWVLRDELHLLGTKFGCGAGLCGACTVLLDGQAVRSCVSPLAMIADRTVNTIEGLGGDHPVQQAWIECSVAQWGSCQSGQIMSAVGLLSQRPDPTAAEIKAAMAGNICRCGTYPRIVSAVQLAATKLKQQPVSLQAEEASLAVDSTIPIEATS